MKNSPFAFNLDSNLVVRNCTLYFRVSVPRKHRIRLGKTEFKYSLHTPYLREARQKAAILSGVTHKIFRMLEGEDAALSKLSDGEIRVLAQKWLDEARLWFEDKHLNRRRPMDEDDMENEHTTYALLESDDMEALITGDLNRAASTADEVLQDNGIKGVKKGSGEYKKLCAELLKARVQSFREAQRFLEGDVSIDFAPAPDTVVSHMAFAAPALGVTQPVVMAAPVTVPSVPLNAPVPVIVTPSPVPVPVAPVVPVPVDLKTLSVAVEEYLREKEQRGSITPNTKEDYRCTLGEFVEVIGDIPANRLGIGDLKRYREFVFNCPARRSILPRYKNKTLQQIIGMSIPPEDRLSPTSMSTRFVKISSFLDWLKTDCQLPLEFKGLFRVVSDKRPDEERDVFTPEDLKALFGCPDYVEDRFRESFQFWLPLLAAYTGARLEELGQLHLDDFKQDEESGLWYLDLRDDSEDKSLKNKTARRRVPLHKDLLEVGLLERVAVLRKQGHDRLFPELTRCNARAKYTDKASQWFGRHVKKLGIRDEGEKKTFHSLRHTFITYFKQRGFLNTPAELQLAEITGHVLSGSETRSRYGKPFHIGALYEDVIGKLDYGLDLSLLKASRFAGGREE